MKHIAITFLFLYSALGWAANNVSDYNINVHVSASRMVRYGNSFAHYQRLSVLIDGKKYELETENAPNALLMLGEYKARLVTDERVTSNYDSRQRYEFHFPDGKTRKFLVVGQLE